jgi:hypothetical protein
VPRVPKFIERFVGGGFDLFARRFCQFRSAELEYAAGIRVSLAAAAAQQKSSRSRITEFVVFLGLA